MNYIVTIMCVILFSGCATWGGIKKDTRDGAEWTKEKINQGASYVKDKTE
ncbi:hypothetical protein [Sulfurospirillum barnesii]|uniref:Entericidin EcnA/B family n=1 Tax=Sulfurospirillum barnesii (strain ATCC 700032 / DSM 10660 / SES-3) TaxID=760154 RepID=I3XV15_SULBS|nr:hypothetical protein [Sulfurospirillum barnesii]AFL67789.1 hypothetical protein Sulba_0471 [Sulfurospirillum barnesii SES-3]